MAKGYKIEGVYNNGLSYCTIDPPLNKPGQFEIVRCAFLGADYRRQPTIPFEDSIVDGKTMLDTLHANAGSASTSNTVLEYRLNAVVESLAELGLKCQVEIKQKAEDTDTITVS